MSIEEQQEGERQPTGSEEQKEGERQPTGSDSAAMIASSVGGALLGAFFGPIGIVIGGAIGAAIGSDTVRNVVARVARERLRQIQGTDQEATLVKWAEVLNRLPPDKFRELREEFAARKQNETTQQVYAWWSRKLAELPPETRNELDMELKKLHKEIEEHERVEEQEKALKQLEEQIQSLPPEQREKLVQIIQEPKSDDSEGGSA